MNVREQTALFRVADAAEHAYGELIPLWSRRTRLSKF